MVRIKPLTTLLVIANLAAFAGGGMLRFDGDIGAVEREIIALEAELPKLKEINAWATRAKQCLENVPEADAGQLLARWSQMAERLGIKLSEAAQDNGRTAAVKLTGNGAINNLTMILNNINAERAALVKRIRLEQPESDDWEFEIVAAVRSGAWEAQGTAEKTPEPAEAGDDNRMINSGRPFAQSVAAQAKPPVMRENIRYIGYFAEQASPAVIIESAGHFAVLKCGEMTPGGAKIRSANADELELVEADGNGKETVRKVKMEKK